MDKKSIVNDLYQVAVISVLAVGYSMLGKKIQPGEEHDDQRHRATDRIWSKGTYMLQKIVENPGNHVMYYLRDGPE